MKKQLLIIFLFIVINFIHAATYNYPGSTTTGTINWQPGDVVNINSNVTFTGATINAWGSASSGVTIYINQSAQVTIAGDSSVYFNGYAYNSNYIQIVRQGASSTHQSFRFLSGSTVRLTNVIIDHPYIGLTIETNNCILNQVRVISPTLASVRLTSVCPRITNCWLEAGSNYAIAATSLPSTPSWYGNTILPGAQSSITMTTSLAASSLFLEGNYWGGSTPIILVNGTNLTVSNRNNVYPVLNSNGWGVTKYLRGVSGADGTINNPNFLMYSGDTWGITNGPITVANGSILHLGVDRNNTSSITYTGNTILGFSSGGYSLNILNGGTIRSEGTTIAPNYIRDVAGSSTLATWGEIDLATGSTGYFANTFIANAVTALDIQTAALTLTNVTLNYNTTAVNSNTNVTISNNYFGNNTTALRITGGTPTVQGNRMVGNTTAFNVSGGTLAVGQIQNNRITGATTFVTSSTGTSGAPVYFERNYWGVATPATANFSGTGTIDYEPWYIDTTLTTTQELAPTATAFIPLDGANIAVAPARLTFNIWEIGYHNGNVDYDLQLANNPTFTGIPGTDLHTFSGSKICNTTTFQDIVGTLPAGNPFWVPNTEYFWRIRTNSPADTIVMPPWSDSIPSASFILQGPQVDLVLTSDRTFASAGQQVLYTVDFTNNSDPSLGSPLSGVRIVNVIPNDVFFDGQIQLSSINDSMGLITVYFYSDTAGTALIGSIGHTPPPADQTYNNPIPAAQNRNVRRIDVVITELRDSTAGGDQNHGIFRYRTVVK